MTGAAEPVVDELISEDVIAERVAGLAKDIARSEPEDLLIVVILKGSFVFAADLISALDRA